MVSTRIQPAPVPPAVRIYDGRRFLDAVADVRKRTPDEPTFSRKYDALAANVKLSAMDTMAIRRDPVAGAALVSASTFLANLKSEFGRDGWDGDGGTLGIAVHMPSPRAGVRNDSFNTVASEDFRGTDGRRVSVAVMNGIERNGRRVTTAEAEGVLDHEIGHMVWEAEVGNPSSAGPWRSALNEAWASALALTFDDDWKLGEIPGFLPDGMYDYAHPPYARLSDLPRPDATMPGTLPWHHAAALTLNQPMVAFAEKFGRKEMGHVWYDALTTHLDPRRIGVKDAARATLEAASHRFGEDSEQVAFLKDRWRDIGTKV